jgi:hypothetical protein
MENKEVIGSAELSLQVPDISHFKDLTAIAKNTPFLQGFPKNELDKIYVGWKGMGEWTSELTRMEKAMIMPGIPDAELKQAMPYYQDYFNAAAKIIDSLNAFKGKQFTERSWKVNGKPIYQAFKEYEDDDTTGVNESTITVLLEAISENKDSYDSEAQMRQKITQSLVDKLWITCEYHKLNYAADTDYDPSMIKNSYNEKDEFVAALNGNVWKAEKIETEVKKLRLLRRVLNEEVWDDEVLEDISLLVRLIKGKGDKNALEALLAADRIYKCLDENGLLDWDPEEEENDEEEDSDEEGNEDI